MSTSLEKDLHSVYIDGEMPESFVPQYEEIISSNAKEKNALERMQTLHSVFSEDSDKITQKIDDKFINESFERLQTKMRYAKNVGFAGSSPEKKSFVTPFVKYASSFAAAAAVFAVVFIPLHYNSLSQTKETAIAAISIVKENGIEPIAQKDVVVDGNISTKGLALRGESEKSENAAIPDSNFIASASIASEPIASAPASLPASAQPEQKTIYATNLASSYGERISPNSNSNRDSSLNRQFRRRLTSVDPFVPDFSSSQIQITISIPNFHEIGNNIESIEIQPK